MAVDSPPIRLHPTVFGQMYEIPLPQTASAIIVATQENGLVPRRLLLPHQLYRKDVIALLEEYGHHNLGKDAVYVQPVLHNWIRVPLDLSEIVT